MATRKKKEKPKRRVKDFRRLKLFTTGDVAELCKVAPRTVSKWFDSGRLRGFRIPGSLDRRIPREHLIRFLKENDMQHFLREIEEPPRVVLVVDPENALPQEVVEAFKAHSIQFKVFNDTFAAGMEAATHAYGAFLFVRPEEEVLPEPESNGRVVATI